MLILLGIPVFFFEICLGQFASLGPLAIWNLSPLFKGVGVAMMSVGLMVALSYCILMSYILFFFFASMGPLPWKDCANSWNTNKCITSNIFANSTLLEQIIKDRNITRAEIKTPSEEYFYNQVLKSSSGLDEPGGIVWQLALCLLLAWVIVFVVLLKGISSLGKVVYFTSTFPYIMMTVMLVRGATLPGASKGIEFYLKPDIAKLKESSVWSDAASQIFYSLSTCTGGLIAMASYNKFKNNTFRDSMIVPFINCGTSLFAGFAIFSVLGFMAKEKGVEVSDVAATGPGLVFVVYPEALSRMAGGTVFSILFFIMMLTLGFSSLFSMVESFFVMLMDEFPDTLRCNSTRPIIFRGVCIVIFYLISLPMVTKGGFYLFSLVNEFAGGFPRLITGLFELLVVTMVYGYSRFAEDISLMIGKKPGIYFQVTWCFLSPLLIVGILIFKAVQFKMPIVNNVVYPSWGAVLGWLMVGGVAIWIPIVFVIQWCRKGGWRVIREESKPAESWGPANLEDRENTRYVLPSPRRNLSNSRNFGTGSIYTSDNWSLSRRNGDIVNISQTSQL
ncbi:DgyrCDS9124 [Dimorphilus gyrociliatus]|nr:DgyrCDS9124 [Dimorphilus gyrociliatus]